MLKLDEATEGKSVQNLKTMIKPDFAYECHLACSCALSASRT